MATFYKWAIRGCCAPVLAVFHLLLRQQQRSTPALASLPALGELQRTTAVRCERSDSATRPATMGWTMRSVHMNPGIALLKGHLNYVVVILSECRL